LGRKATANNQERGKTMEFIETILGTLDGKEVKAYNLKSAGGAELTCMEYGCIITKINLPDRYGNTENIVLGFDTLEEYLNHSPYFGCVVGRSAGRIKNAAFEIEGVTYKLSKNDGENNLHGGPNGFHQVIWDSAVEKTDSEVKIIFSYLSPNGEEGFPGNLDVSVIYAFNDQNELLITYKAVSDQKTIVNLTNHSYFNLSGNLKRTILEHELTLPSDRFLELDEALLPIGRMIPVEGTVFDFQKGRRISEGIESGDPQTIMVGGGFDHPFLLNQKGPICLFDHESGRKLEIETEEPAVVFYSGNMLPDDFSIRGVQSQKHLGLCLETQKPPGMMDALFLEKNQVYLSKTKYRFALV
jgi:aldose 1-epimerase